jgi:cytochrome c-type biogenesis protein CcmH
MTRAVATLALAALLVLAGAAVATAACPRTTAAAFEDRVMCEVCGTPLALAGDAPQARRERALIARLVRRCADDREVEAALVAEFGPGVLALPPHRGFAASAYVVPAVALALALAGLALGVARVRARRRRGPPAVPRALADDDARRLARELERFGA